MVKDFISTVCISLCHTPYVCNQQHYTCLSGAQTKTVILGLDNWLILVQYYSNKGLKLKVTALNGRCYASCGVRVTDGHHWSSVQACVFLLSLDFCVSAVCCRLQIKQIELTYITYIHIAGLTELLPSQPPPSGTPYQTHLGLDWPGHFHITSQNTPLWISLPPITVSHFIHCWLLVLLFQLPLSLYHNSG